MGADAGSGGFHMKGNAYKGFQEFAARAVPGGLEAVSERVSAATRSFIAQSFVAGAWYDVLPIEELTRVAASLAREPHELFCKRFGDSTLKRDQNGVYRAILRFASPDLLVRALPFTTKRYFDFVHLDVAGIEKRSYRVTVAGVPRQIAMTYMHVTTVFITRAIEGSGGKAVQAENSLPRPGPLVQGVPTVVFERTLRWT